MSTPFKSLLNRPLIRNSAVKAMRTFVPPPYLSDTMEFEHGVWVGISSAHSDSGRQLGEDNTAPTRFKELIDTERRPCKFEDSRKGGVINMTALRSLLACWDEALLNTLAIRNIIAQRYCQDRERLNVIELYMLSRLAVSLPAYLLRCNDKRTRDGELTEMVAVLFQLLAGIFMIVRQMIDSGQLDLSESSYMTAEELFDYADENRILSSPTGPGVCGGSKLKIVELLECAINGHTERDLPRDQATIFDQLDVDIDALMDYTELTVLMELELHRLRFQMNHDLSQTIASDDVNNDQLKLSLKQQFFSPAGHGPEIDDEQQALQRRINTCASIMQNCTLFESLALAPMGSTTDAEPPPVIFSSSVVGAKQSVKLVTQLLDIYCLKLNSALEHSARTQVAINTVLGRNTDVTIDHEALMEKFGVPASEQLKQAFDLDIEISAAC